MTLFLWAARECGEGDTEDTAAASEGKGGDGRPMQLGEERRRVETESWKEMEKMEAHCGYYISYALDVLVNKTCKTKIEIQYHGEAESLLGKAEVETHSALEHAMD